MKELFTTEEAANYLGYSAQTLRASRMEGGTLDGLEPPKHQKLGSRGIRYRLSVLKAWADSLPKG